MNQSSEQDNSASRKKRARRLSCSTAGGSTTASTNKNNNDSRSPHGLYSTITPPTNNDTYTSNKKTSVLNVSDREIQAYKEESLRSKNQLRMERVKWEQTEARLRRQIKFLMEESESNRVTIEEDRKKSEEELERVTMDRNEVLSSLRQAELQITSSLHNTESANGRHSGEGMLYQKKNEMLSQKVEMLEEDIMQLNTELSTKERKVHELEVSVADLTASSPKTEASLSTASPAVLTELNRSRVILSETQRKLRVQCKRAEELQAELTTLLPIKEISNLLKSKNAKLEQENAALLKENLLARNSKTAWETFYRRLNSAFPELVPQEKLVSSPHLATCSIPPEVSCILRHFQALQSSLSSTQADILSLQTQTKEYQQQIKTLTNSLTTSQSDIQSLKTEKKDYQHQIKTLSISNRKLLCCEVIHKREVESIQSLLKQTTTDDQKSAVQVLERSLSTSKLELKTTESSYQTIQQELSTKHKDFIKLQQDYDTILSKFQLLKDALMTEREKASTAEDRANQAESLAGKGSYNINTTRVLHLQSNPLLQSLKQKYESQIESLLAERRDMLQESSESSFFSSPVGNNTQEKSIADAQKFNQRLKEGFKEQIALFREGVYLLTGLKIDMFTTTDQPTFKLRSMYAEREDDHLLFVWPEKYKKGTSVTSLDLLHSDFAQEVSNTDSFLYMTQYKSIPSFIASLTLKLFEVQTLA